MPSVLICSRTNERPSWGRRNDVRKTLACGGGGGPDEVGSSARAVSGWFLPRLLATWECRTVFSCQLSPFSHLRNSAEKWSAFERQWRGGLKLGCLRSFPCHQGVGARALRFSGTLPFVLFQAYKCVLVCATAMTGCLITGDTDGTATPTDLKTEARLLERTITRPARGTGGDPEAESSTVQRSISITAGNAGPGLVAVPPR